MVKRGLADLYALAWIASIVFIIVTLMYGFLGFFHVFGLSFHLEFLFSSLVFWIVMCLLFSWLFLREYDRLLESQKGDEGVSS